MNLYLALFLLFIVFCGAWFIGRFGTRHRTPEVESLPREYFRGLNFLLNEERDKALEVLVTALEKDKETIEVQLALGSLFRRRGEIQRATRVHQNLVARTQLDKNQRLRAIYELAQDYYKAGLFDRAEHLLLEINDENDLEDSPKRLLLQIYEQEKEWENAISIASQLPNLGSDKNEGIIAHYNCDLAETSIAEGKYINALSYISNAFKIDSRCARAMIQAGRLKAIQGDHRGAVNEWMHGAKLHKELPGEICHLIYNSFKVLNELEEYRDFLVDTLDSVDDIRLVLALTEYLTRYESEKKAEKFLLKKIRSTPSISGLHRLIQLRLTRSTGETNTDLHLLEKLIGGIVDESTGYACKHCGFQGKVMHWQCPGCRNWNTTQARIHQKLDVIS